MTADFTRGSPNTPLQRPAASVVVRWLLGLFFVVLALLLLAVFIAALFVLRSWSENRVAAKAVKEKIARLQQAGEPMTADDLYRFHAIPENVVDTTDIWLAAQKSCNPARLYPDGKPFPFVGDGNAADLRQGAGEAQLAVAEKFLAQYAPALQAILAAAQQPGECRYPTKFEQGFSATSSDVQGVRTMVRLLALNVHVTARRGQSDQTLESLAAMFAASDTISHPTSIVEQQIRIATLGSALQQTEFLLNEVQLNDEQLPYLARQLAACDIQASFTRSLIGERALGAQQFQQQFGEWRSADCLAYLDVMTKSIKFSAEPLPEGRNHMLGLLDQFEAQTRATPAGSNHVLTALSLPSIKLAFDSNSTAAARQRALCVSIAAEHYRLKNSQFPARLADLVPDYLPAVPIDPFDGQPLRIRADGSAILIYSIGIDGQDDGSQNPPGNVNEPDIVIRLSSIKAMTP